MSHHHHHPEIASDRDDHSQLRVSERRRLVLVMWPTGLTMVAEFVGGYISGSVARNSSMAATKSFSNTLARPTGSFKARGRLALSKLLT